jgi:hypothetical protein
MDPSQSISEPIELRTDLLWLEETGLVCTRTLPGATVSLSDAEAYTKVVKEFGKGTKVKILNDARAVKGMEKAARNYFSKSPKFFDAVAGIAVIVASPVSRAVVNFMMGLNKPMVPIQMFTTEADARQWLSTIVVD